MSEFKYFMRLNVLTCSVGEVQRMACARLRGNGTGPAGTAAAGPMLEAKLMNLIKGRLQKF